MLNGDIIGSVGVVMMLAGFFLNLTDKLDDDNILYILLNLVGSILACIASCIISYTPFIILEGTWALISAWGVYDWFKKRYIVKPSKSED
jgi:hypothetical protein